jgi:hypothetical protein
VSHDVDLARGNEGLSRSEERNVGSFSNLDNWLAQFFGVK